MCLVGRKKNLLHWIKPPTTERKKCCLGFENIWMTIRNWKWKVKKYSPIYILYIYRPGPPLAKRLMAKILPPLFESLLNGRINGGKVLRAFFSGMQNERGRQRHCPIAYMYVYSTWFCWNWWNAVARLVNPQKSRENWRALHTIRERQPGR